MPPSLQGKPSPKGPGVAGTAREPGGQSWSGTACVSESKAQDAAFDRVSLVMLIHTQDGQF